MQTRQTRSCGIAENIAVSTPDSVSNRRPLWVRTHNGQITYSTAGIYIKQKRVGQQKGCPCAWPRLFSECITLRQQNFLPACHPSIAQIRKHHDPESVLRHFSCSTFILLQSMLFSRVRFHRCVPTTCMDSGLSRLPWRVISTAVQCHWTSLKQVNNKPILSEMNVSTVVPQWYHRNRGLFAIRMAIWQCSFNEYENIVTWRSVLEVNDYSIGHCTALRWWRLLKSESSYWSTAHADAWLSLLLCKSTLFDKR